MNILGAYKKYRKAYKNPISVMWNIFRKEKFISVVLKDGREVGLTHFFTVIYPIFIESFPEKEKSEKFIESALRIQKPDCEDQNGKFIQLDYNNYHIKLYIPFKTGNLDLSSTVEVFLFEVYKFLRPEGAIIIDIGANIGDSAIYFCLNNANRVIALEPFPYSYNFATLNITANSLVDKIQLLNAGYGKDSIVNVQEGESSGLSLLTNYKKGKKIEVYSLKTIFNKYGLDTANNILLKIDCEGCEYNLLDEPIEILNKFKKIQIEFHYGYKNLESKLKEAGFSVNLGIVTRSGGQNLALREMALANDDMTFGYIYAERN